MTTFSNTVTDSVALTDPIVPMAGPVLITSMDFTNTISLNLGEVLAIESLIISDSNSNNQVSELLILEYLNAIDSTISLIKGNAVDSIAFTNTASALLRSIIEVLSSINLSDINSTRTVFKTTLTELLILLGTNEKLYLQIVNSGISFSNVVVDLLSALTSISTDLLVTSTASNKSLFLVSLETDSIFSDTYSTSARFKEALLSTISFLIPDSDSPTGYTTYAFSPETSSITEYDNYKFDGVTKFGSKYLFYNSSGLYEYGGVTDNTTPILINFMTAATSFKKSNLKRVPTVYMGLSSNNVVYLKVKVDGKAEVTYKLNKHTDNLQTQKIDIGKGLVGRYFQFEVLTYSTDFNMESIEFFPIEIERKI